MDANTKNNISIGLDIGTTTISAAVLDIHTETVLATCTVPNQSALPSEHPWEHMQSPDWIWKKVKSLLDTLLQKYTVSSIGVTGQMHGILCTAHDGTVLSPLYTWQDGRAGQGKDSTCAQILQKTGYVVPEGYGLATLYHLTLHGQIPVEPYYCCTIMDYITMRLCDLARPVMHITNAAAWGLYQHKNMNFDIDALEKLEINTDILPEVIAENRVLGTYRDIPVTVAIGDNQAAFIGSVKEPEHMILVNIGTGSQISMLSEIPVQDTSGLVESRPFDGRRYLLSGSALCGGRAYAILENFFRRYAVTCGLPDTPQYEFMNSLAAEGVKNGSALSVTTTFCGTRADPCVRGEVTGIGENNLTPESLAAGVLYGIARELHGMFQMMPVGHILNITASGNGIRKNSVLQEVVADVFGMPVQISACIEEAACGAAIWSLKNNALK
ncbi:MAG: hypothetical protein E7631_05915 [Ruminococcaceae bacterium]|nr:hypothetical protein [Oscillospiraceae bacterium]